MEPASQLTRKDLGDQFCKTVNQTDWTEILDMQCIIFLGKEDDIYAELRSPTLHNSAPYRRNCSHNVILYDRPASLVEVPSKPIGSRGLVR
jgi:hypothetical protein